MVNKLFEFIEKSPTAFHAVETASKELLDAGFIRLYENEVWNLKNNGFAHLDEYFGHNLNCNNIFTYAPSSNGFVIINADGEVAWSENEAISRIVEFAGKY